MGRFLSRVLVREGFDAEAGWLPAALFAHICPRQKTQARDGGACIHNSALQQGFNQTSNNNYSYHTIRDLKFFVGFQGL